PRARQGVRGVLPRHRRSGRRHQGQRPGALDREGIRGAPSRQRRDPRGAGRAFPHPLPAQARGGGSRMRGRLALALAAGVLGLSACSLFERPAPSETPSAPVAEAVSAPAAGTSTAQELMAYMARLRTMNETALNAETSRQRQAMQRHPSDLARLKIAIAMTVAPQGEESDILAIVDPIARRETG